MTIDSRTEGALLALRFLVAQALAVAARAHDDPRGALRDTLMALEDDIAAAIAATRGVLANAEVAAMEDGARTTVIAVAQTADAYLAAMGARPAG